MPVGTVPIYQAAIEVAERKGGIVQMTADDIFAVIEHHAEDGVDFITVHCGVTRQHRGAAQEPGQDHGRRQPRRRLLPSSG